MVNTMHSRVLRALRAWCADNTGVVALIFAFCLPAFVAAAGVAVDLSQAYNVKSRLGNALDKAALAAGSTNGTEDQIRAQVTAFFNANYQSGALGTPHDVVVTLPPGMVDVQASSTVHTVFMGIFGQPTIEVTAETIVKRDVAGLELVLVMDNTGSMAQTAGGSVSKIDAAKTAANTLFDILFGASSNVPTLYIGVVPFSQDVNIGTSRASWTSSNTYNWGPAGWMGCVESRYTGGKDLTDDPPSSALFPQYYSACSTTTGNTWYSTVGSDVSANGDFSSSTGWTVSPDWNISGGLLNRPAAQDIVTNGDFSSSTGWTMDHGWSIASGALTNAPVQIVTNGTFGSTSNWVVGTNWGISSGVLQNSPSTSSTTGTTSQTPAAGLIVNGHSYNVVYTLTRSSNSVKERIGGGTYSASHSATGTINETLVAGSGSTIDFTGVTGFKGTIDNLTATDMTTVVTQTPSTALISGHTYQVTFTVTARTAGSINADVGGTNGTSRSTTGTFTENITAGAGTTVGLETANGFTGSVDDFSVIDVTSPTSVTRTASPALSTSTTYLVTYTISSISAGSVKSMVGNKTGAVNSTTGTFTDQLKPSSTNGSVIGLQTSNGFVGTIDNFSVQPLTTCGSGPNYVYASPLDTTTQGPNYLCAQQMQEMTSTKATLQAAVATMAPAGDTEINTGMAWGWRMLSPRWRGLWGGVMDTNNLPLDYNTPSMNKAVILMTDGDNTYLNNLYQDYGLLSAGNLGTTSSSTAVTILNNKTLSICSAMKANNILIYTIALGSSFTTTSQNMLKSCATGPAYYFASPTTTALQNAFTTIANQLNSLHITH